MLELHERLVCTMDENSNVEREESENQQIASEELSSRELATDEV